MARQDHLPPSRVARAAGFVVHKEELIKLAGQYSTCAGCSAAVKGLLSKPVFELRLLNAVMDEGQETDCLILRKQYENPAQLQKLMSSFSLSSILKKTQAKGGQGQRCELHRRSLAHTESDWEDMWERLPRDQRICVGVVDVNSLEAAVLHATATHRFCTDCKHNVLTAFDILTCRCDVSEVAAEEEWNPDLFWPFAGKICEDPISGGRTLTVPAEEVEELIFWHEDFDGRDYAQSSQRHAATLEHGQREIRSIVGRVLLNQLRMTWHNHLANVQGEQFLLSLVLHALRARIHAVDDELLTDEICVGESEPASPDVESGTRASKSKSRKKKERLQRSKARKAEAANHIVECEEQCSDCAASPHPCKPGAENARSLQEVYSVNPCMPTTCTGGGNSDRPAPNSNICESFVGGDGSLLSMLNDVDEGEDDVEDLDLLREMELLRAQKPGHDKSRAKLRMNLQRNFAEMIQAQQPSN